MPVTELWVSLNLNTAAMFTKYSAIHAVYRTQIIFTGFWCEEVKHIYTYFYLPSIHISLQLEFSSLPPFSLVEYSCLGIEVASPGPAWYKAILCAIQLLFASSVSSLPWREITIEPHLEASTHPSQDTEFPLTQTPGWGSPLNQRKSEYLNIIIWFQRNQTMPIFLLSFCHQITPLLYLWILSLQKIKSTKEVCWSSL